MFRLRGKLGELTDIYLHRGISGVFQSFGQIGRNQKAKRLYRKWVTTYDTLDDAERRAICQKIEELSYQPLISVVMPVFNVDEKWLRQAIESVQQQLYQNWELCIADDNSTKPHILSVLKEYAAKDARIKIVFRPENGHISAASNSALALATGDFVALLDHDDKLSEHALYLVLAELNNHPEADMIYSDEDLIDENNRRYEPKFKPDWSQDLFYSTNLVTHLSVYRTSVLRQIGGFRLGYEGSQDYDLALRVIEQIPPHHIRHIPHILYHWRAIPGSVALSDDQKSYAHERARQAINSHFERIGSTAKVNQGFANLHRAIYSLPEEKPLVSLILIGRAGGESIEAVESLNATVESIKANTNYQNFEILAETSRDSAAINSRANTAKGEVMVFLQNGTEVVEKDWLQELTSQALRPEVGAVGAKLLFRNQTIRDAGIVFGVNGLAGFAHRGFTREATGHFVRAQLINNFSAVSGACLAVRRGVFNEVGGFDAQEFPNEFYDLDFCLRLGEKGYRIVWTPYATFTQTNDSPTERSLRKLAVNKIETVAIKRFRQKWRAVIERDKFYNPNLTLKCEDFSVAIPPRFAKPWLTS